jgi:benzaldehyde dehydrogenase (NAD)
MLMKASQALEAKGEAIAAAMAAETGASGIWAGFNVHLAASMLLEAASLTTQINGEIIPPTCPAAWPWPCASPPAWCWASRPGMPP